MKRIVFGGLTMLLATVALMPGVNAQTVQTGHVGNANPSQIVTLAERGYFKNQGIPSGNRLSSSYEFRQLTAKQVVQAAINDRRIPASTLEDASFIAAVDAQLHRLSSMGDGNN